MAEPPNVLDAAYSQFTTDVLAQVRRETFGEDLGQYSWTVKSELDMFCRALELFEGKRLLDVACGAGGPALYAARTTGCLVIGVDVNEHAIETASRLAHEGKLSDRVIFQKADASQALPFPDASFDALLCLDAVVLFPDRSAAIRDWARLLKPGGRLLFTNPAVLSGLVTFDELAARSADANFVFSPPGVDERLIRESGLRLVRSEDSTAIMASVAWAWHESRSRHEAELVKLEGPEMYRTLQRFYESTHHAAGERRISRFTYVAERPRGRRPVP